jgi:hypothetical protein
MDVTENPLWQASSALKELRTAFLDSFSLYYFQVQHFGFL